MTFRAVRADKTDAGQTVRFVDMEDADLMEGDVTIRVTHSTVNYKDGLALSGKSPIIRSFPMVLGVDLAGVVETSRRPDFAPGDEVILTGHGLSETHFGGYAGKARVNGDWLVKLPAGLTRAEAMAVGTAGFTAMLALMAIERAGIEPSAGPALVTGAAGGVGSMAISLLADKGWSGRSPRPGGSPRPAISRRSARPRSSTGRRSAPPASRSARSAGRRRSTASARRRSPMCWRRRSMAARSRLAGLPGAWTYRQRSPRSSSAACRSWGSRASTALPRAGSRRGGGSPPTSIGPSSRR